MTNLTPGTTPDGDVKQSNSPSAWAAENCGQILREAVTAVISLAIVLVVLWLLVDTHRGAGAEAHARQKEILALGLGLIGTVMGYYFGRVPAERHADAMRGAAREATRAHEQTKRKVRDSLIKIQKHHNASEPANRPATEECNAEIEDLRSTL